MTSTRSIDELNGTAWKGERTTWVRPLGRAVPMFGYQPSAEPNGVAKMEQMLAAISPGDPSPETAITLTTESGSHFAFETATRSFCGEFVEDAVELDNVSCAKCRRAMVALRKGGFVKTGMFACGAITRVGERCTRKPRADGYCTLHTDLAEAAA